MIRNPLSYPGNKNKLIKQIVPELSSSETIVDVFSGSGVVAVNSNSKKIILNDKNEWSIRITKALYENDIDCIISEIERRINEYGLTYSRIHPKGFYKEYKHEGLSQYNKTAYLELKNHFNKTFDIFDLIVLEIYGFNHYIRFNSRNEFNVPVGKVDFSDSIYKDLIEFVKLLQTKEADFFNYDFRNDILYKYDKAFYYFDPPYLITTAPYNQNWSVNDEQDLLSLLDLLNNNGKRFALSNVLLSNGKTNDLLIKWSEKYNVVYLKRQYRNANYQKKNITDSIEVLIKNY